MTAADQAIEAEAAAALEASKKWQQTEYAFGSERSGRRRYIEHLLKDSPNREAILAHLEPTMRQWSNYAGD